MVRIGILGVETIARGKSGLLVPRNRPFINPIGVPLRAGAVLRIVRLARNWSEFRSRIIISISRLRNHPGRSEINTLFHTNLNISKHKTYLGEYVCPIE